jgi:hypothetical protein
VVAHVQLDGVEAGLRHNLGDPAGLVVVLAAQQVVMDPGGMRHAGV